MLKHFSLLLMSTFVFGQTMKEDLEFYDNGQSRVQVYKNLDLETVKRNTFSANGKLLSSFNSGKCSCRSSSSCTIQLE